MVEEHNHSGSVSNILKIKAVNKIKKRSRRTNEVTSNVLAQGISNLPPEVAAQIPRIESRKRTIQRVRKASRPRLINPVNRASLVLTEFFSVTSKNEPFVLYNGGGPDRLIIFSTKKNISLLKRCEVWCSDGTFSAVPSIFEQLYTIHGYK